MTKNILIISLALFAIMSLATLVTLGFNSFVGFSTDIDNNEVATSIAAVAFTIALALRYFYEKKD